MIEEIKKRIIESDIPPHDLKIVLDILDEIKKEQEVWINTISSRRSKNGYYGGIVSALSGWLGWRCGTEMTEGTLCIKGNNKRKGVMPCRLYKMSIPRLILYLSSIAPETGQYTMRSIYKRLNTNGHFRTFFHRASSRKNDKRIRARLERRRMKFIDE